MSEKAKPVKLRQLIGYGDDPPSSVQIFLGDGPDAEQSSQWISARVAVETPPLRTFALLQLNSLTSMQNLIAAEISRLREIYDQAERARS
jgi:hypothetical protein